MNITNISSLNSSNNTVRINLQRKSQELTELIRKYNDLKGYIQSSTHSIRHNRTINIIHLQQKIVRDFGSFKREMHQFNNTYGENERLRNLKNSLEAWIRIFDNQKEIKLRSSYSKILRDQERLPEEISKKYEIWTSINNRRNASIPELNVWISDINQDIQQFQQKIERQGDAHISTRQLLDQIKEIKQAFEVKLSCKQREEANVKKQRLSQSLSQNLQEWQDFLNSNPVKGLDENIQRIQTIVIPHWKTKIQELNHQMQRLSFYDDWKQENDLIDQLDQILIHLSIKLMNQKDQISLEVHHTLMKWSDINQEINSVTSVQELTRFVDHIYQDVESVKHKLYGKGLSNLQETVGALESIKNALETKLREKQIHTANENFKSRYQSIPWDDTSITELTASFSGQEKPLIQFLFEDLCQESFHDKKITLMRELSKIEPFKEHFKEMFPRYVSRLSNHFFVNRVEGDLLECPITMNNINIKQGIQADQKLVYLIPDHTVFLFNEDEFIQFCKRGRYIGPFNPNSDLIQLRWSDRGWINDPNPTRFVETAGQASSSSSLQNSSFPRNLSSRRAPLSTSELSSLDHRLDFLNSLMGVYASNQINLQEYLIFLRRYRESLNNSSAYAR